jgi:hypothetical protein
MTGTAMCKRKILNKVKVMEFEPVGVRLGGALRHGILGWLRLLTTVNWNYIITQAAQWFHVVCDSHYLVYFSFITRRSVWDGHTVCMLVCDSWFESWNIEPTYRFSQNVFKRHAIGDHLNILHFIFLHSVIAALWMHGSSTWNWYYRHIYSLCGPGMM